MFNAVFDPEGLTPHGFCLSWRSDLFWSTAISDIVIALSYASISLVIVVFLHRRKTMHMRWVGWLFAAFILLCSVSHALDAWTLWFPDYALQSLEKAATALVSAISAILLWPLLPKALKIPTGSELNALIEERTHELQAKTAMLSESNADLEQFAYVASHDLQTPLRNIVHYSQLLARRYGDKMDADAKDFLAFIVDGGKHMSQMIEDLLQYARVTSQGRPLEPVPAMEAVALALENLRLQVEAAGAEVVTMPLPVVMAEPARLVSLFQNLILNAIKYAHSDRRPHIVVSAERAAGTLWRFSVSDNGIGIEPQYSERIFQIFERLDPKRGKDGTGIGLTLCRRIVHRFGGTIWLDSRPDEGSTFFFTLRDAAARTVQADRGGPVAARP